MIGNDIIDLKAARRESNWRRPRFLQKLFTKSERVLIESSKVPESTLWLLWSMKESAYKIWIQHGAQRFFAPKRICCKLGSDAASVTIDNMVFDTQSIISDEYIYTLAFRQKNITVSSSVSQLFPIEKYSKERISQVVYDNLLADYASKKATPLDNLRLKKAANGVPFLVDRNKRLETSISLTHHGSYGAFAWVQL